ncbi:MAG: hypothetical protein B7733_09870 [Myxococcales bacterium FL481]|nr:MAG: hypothetical protein B7733_09870 [Myxococcales bacterium FL481]
MTASVAHAQGSSDIQADAKLYDITKAAAEEPVATTVDKTCLPVFGRFTADVVPPPACESPVGFCTEGELTGFLRGKYTLTSEQFIETGDPRVPFVTFFTGTSEVTTSLGSFVGVDTGSINLSEPGSIGSGRVSTLITIVENGSGGGYFPIDAGYLHIRGESDLASGTVDGYYAGVVCWDP